MRGGQGVGDRKTWGAAKRGSGGGPGARAGAVAGARAGEQRGAEAKRAVVASLPATLRWFAAAAPGLEAPLAIEVAQLPGVSEVVETAGGVEFTGGLAVGQAANLRLRVATRVLLRLGTVRARDFAKLRAQASALPWASVVSAERPVRFDVTARASRLYHTGAIADALVLAISDRLGGKLEIAGPLGRPRAEGAIGAQISGAVASALDVGAAPTAVSREGGEDTEEESAQRIFVRGQNDEWTLSVDSSGELLHKRGWRTEAGEAPLRETLAAGLLALAGYDPRRPFCDLMCGSGTIVIEAAAIARDRPPGVGRRFAYQLWPAVVALSSTAIAETAAPCVSLAPRSGERVGARGLRADAIARQDHDPEDTSPAMVHGDRRIGFDADPAMIEIARRNAARAGVADAVSFSIARVGGAPGVPSLPADPGLVVVNPPYGRRLGHKGEAARLVRQLGRELRQHFRGWRAGILLADPRWVSALGLPIVASHRLHNGGFPLSYVVCEIPGPVDGRQSRT